MRAASILAIVLAGCGGAPPPDDGPNDNARHRHAGGEAACVERSPAAPALAGLDGRWFLLEPGDDDVEMVIDLAGGRGTAWAEDPSESMAVTVVPRADGLGGLALSMPGDGVIRVLLVPRGPGSMLAIAEGEEDARIARRAAPVPAFLEGAWTLADPRGREAPVELQIRGDRASTAVRGETREVRLYGLAPDGPTIDVVGQRQDRERADFLWLRLQTVSPDVLIVREGDDEEFRVMHRPGLPPAWLAELFRARPGAAEPPATAPMAPPID